MSFWPAALETPATAIVPSSNPSIQPLPATSNNRPLDPVLGTGPTLWGMSTERSPLPSRKGPIATVVGALVAAALASACCVGPLLLGVGGLGGAAFLVRL